FWHFPLFPNQQTFIPNCSLSIFRYCFDHFCKRKHFIFENFRKKMTFSSFFPVDIHKKMASIDKNCPQCRHEFSLAHHRVPLMLVPCGHSMCSACVPSHDSCSVCKQPYSATIENH